MALPLIYKTFKSLLRLMFFDVCQVNSFIYYSLTLNWNTKLDSFKELNKVSGKKKNKYVITRIPNLLFELTTLWFHKSGKDDH